MFNVVPEFGAIAIVVMFVAITAVVLMSSKYIRVIPKL
jgi:predicted secreted protein with PEFG-CTERM motif